MNEQTPLRHDPENWRGEVIVPPEAPFSDARGDIIPLVDAHMRSAVLITSRKGTVRANHYHRTDWHYCYVLEGGIDYYHRPVGDTSPPEKLHVGPGQIFFTPAMVEHAMVFTEDTVFLTLGGNPRDQESYERDLVRVELVDPASVT
jgi:quercetin dioxygenase-like cupin family protein